MTELAEEVTSRLAAVKDAKLNFAFQSDRLARAVAGKRETVEVSKCTLATVQDLGLSQEVNTWEHCECWKMRVEELIQQLGTVNGQALAAARVGQRAVPVLPLLQREQGKWRQLEEVMGICLELLGESVEFYEGNAERSTFIVSAR